MKLTELFTGPEKWTKEAAARDARGSDATFSDAPGAVCWCLMGGVTKCYPTITPQERNRVSDKIRNAALLLYPVLMERCNLSLVSFNDHPSTTFEHIRAVVEKAGV